MIKELKNEIKIVLPDKLTEITVNDFHKELVEYGFDKDSTIEKMKNKTINFDFTHIEQVDFFGFQHLISFYQYLQNKLDPSHISLSQKPDLIIQFEKQLGLKL